ncbi:MAG TPA: DoxX family protein [Isosphaeraceae bacterium]|nr:DoxX family protein [Isosphaeraceae bacterium]
MARYYPGFLAALFLILLRIAIGWHFLAEGWEKHRSTQYGTEPFSAEIYLRNATGPLAPYFRGMVPDVNGLALLDESRLKAAWRSDVERIADHYRFSEAQRSQAAKVLDEAERWARYWFNDPENHEKRLKYYHDLGVVQRTERDPDALSFQLERAWDARRSLDADRRTLTGPLVQRGNLLRTEVEKLATSDQLATDGPVPRLWTQLDLINFATTYGLIAIGTCLILGLLTPLAALGAAAFLAMIYLSMPPWPGLPPNPRAEGHYFIVSKNLVELIACLVVATTPNGHWIGLDALLFARRRRLAPPGDGRTRIRTEDPNRPVTKTDPGREPIPIG